MSKKSLANTKNIDISLPIELAKIIEAGIERQLNQSILYSPFRLFLRLFKSKNPQLVQRVQMTLRIVCWKFQILRLMILCKIII